jgi:signal transduction histidine kinase
VSLAEAGPDVARYNQLESAALLSSGVAHDLMNVLHTLVMHAEIGNDRAQLSVVRTHFERIHAGSVRASELVSLMRRYLRGERTTGSERMAVAPATIVEEVVELLRPAIPHDLTVIQELDPTCAVLAEPIHVHQIVLNLVSNAVHALDGWPAPRVTISVAHAGDCVQLVVADNGPGLAPAVRERAFEPYVTTKAERGGSGLGLAVVHTLVAEALGGDVRVDDAPGGGARFTVTLPALTVGSTAEACPDDHGPASVAAGS